MTNVPGSSTILIVEDSPTQAGKLIYLLEKNGFQVHAAADGSEALNLLNDGLRPKMVISDIRMPEIDGYELCRNIRADERFSDLLVMLLTSLSDPKDLIRGLECGANCFITKPYKESMLISRIQYLYSNAKLREHTDPESGIDVIFFDEHYHITSKRPHILDLLLSTYDNAWNQNNELIEAQDKLRDMNDQLEDLVIKRTAELYDTNKQLQSELAQRRKAEEQLKLYADSLEEKVRERTSEIEKANKELRKLFNAIEQSGESVVVTDINGTIQYVNPFFCKRTGYSREEALGNNPRVLKSGLVQNEVYDELWKTILSGRTWRGTLINRKKTGELFYEDATIAPVFDDSGGIVNFVAVKTDVTEKIQHEEELALKNRELEEARTSAVSANKAKSDFLANMSHELRTPLNAIIGFSEVMADGMTGGLTDEQMDYLKDITESGYHLLSLINDILDLSKVEAGKMELEIEEFDLGELLEGSLVMIKEKAMKHGISIQAEVEEGVENIKADERKIKQVMFNLLSNAIKFTPDGGSVFVSARRGKGQGKEGISLLRDPMTLDSDGNFVEISVADTGIGISPEDQKRLFQPFHQIESGYQKKTQGTGLGLKLSKDIVELHGGRIWIESEAGKGSRFVFVMPVEQ